MGRLAWHSRDAATLWDSYKASSIPDIDALDLENNLVEEEDPVR